MLIGGLGPGGLGFYRDNVPLSNNPVPFIFGDPRNPVRTNLSHELIQFASILFRLYIFFLRAKFWVE